MGIELNIVIRFICLVTILFGFLNVAIAEDGAEIPNWKEDALTGNWGGLREDLYQKGIDFEIVHKSDLMANVSGGLKRGSVWMGYTSIQSEFDLDKLFGWQNTTSVLQYHSGLGGKLNTNYVGGFVGEDNIEVSTNTAQFYQAWIQKKWFEDNLSMLAGLYAVDTEYYVTDVSSIFIQAPYGMANEFAQAGVNGPPIFPLSALGLRVKYFNPTYKTYIQAAITDGVPGDPNDPRGTHVKLGSGDGTLSVVELGYHPAHSGDFNKNKGIHKLAIGFWGFTSKFDDLTSLDAFGNPLKRRNNGFYAFSEGGVYREDSTSAQGINAFVRVGVADKNINQANWTYSVGAVYQGLFPDRNDDVLGVAITVNHASDKYKTLNNAVSPEKDFEITYKAQIFPYLVIQPTFQYITNPGMDKSLENSTVIGIRTEIYL